MNAIEIVSIILSLVIAIIAIVVAFKTDILKVGNPNGDMQYSFSKFQLFLWTLVICPLFVLHWGFHYQEPGLQYINTCSLILLGISIGTAVGSGGVDVAQMSAKAKGAVPFPVNIKAAGNKSSGFWADILTGDDNILSVHRLQNLLFTFVYVVIYIIMFFETDLTYPDFRVEAYYLMGISSGGYVIGKGLHK